MIRPRIRSIAPLFPALALVGILAAGCMAGRVTTIQSTIVETITAAPSTGGAGPSSAAGSCPTSQPAPLAAGEKRTLTIDTPKGKIVVAIDGSLSPIATGNIVALAACGWYDGVVFHRVVPGFVIPGGDGQYGRVGPDGKLTQPGRAGTGNLGYTIKDEPVTTTYKRGTVAMARSSAPDSVGSQFFIVLDDKDQAVLASANTYQIIGSVATGMDTVDAIYAAAGGRELPVSPIAMTKVTVSNP